MNIEDQITAMIALKNNTPLDNFSGLSPNEMHQILYNSLGEHAPVQWRSDIDDETLDQIPIFRVVEAYLEILKRDGFLKLTLTGALPKKVVLELYEKRFLLDEFIEDGINKLAKEADWIALQSARIAVGLAGLVRKANGKLTLTKSAIKLMEKNDRVQIFKLFLQAYTSKLNWGYHDLYEAEPCGPFGWTFSVYLLDKFGEQPHKSLFYGGKYLLAFPMLIDLFIEDKYSSKEEQLVGCYGIRTFERFFLWFGFVKAVRGGKFAYLEKDLYEPTDLLWKVFKVNKVKPEDQ